MGFGYLKSNKEFREKYKDWVYINLGRREDGYHTVFYILTNVALWRKTDGKLKPAYQSFGYLKSSEFAQIKEKVHFINDKCPICKKPRKRIISGLEIFPVPEEVKNSIFISNKEVSQELLTEKTSNVRLDKLLKHTQNRAYLINISENEIVFGGEMKYKRVVREYKLLDIDGLREITMKNKVQYRRDKKRREKDEKQSNGYG